MDLYEWTKHYIAFKDILKRQIVKKTYLTTSIVVEEKKEKKLYLVMETLSDSVESIKKTKGKKTIIVTHNTITNCNTLIKEWDIFAQEANITIIFVNVDLDDKWIIHPATHQHIADKKNLKEGIFSLHNVEKK
ncbi:MAG: hypothetical protein ACOCQQ_00065 [Candidatus Nanoarchaeia archaeon]